MIQDEFELRCQKVSDINEHLPILKAYAEECDTIVEMGVRSLVSTWAFLAGHSKRLTSIDIKHPNQYLNHDPLSDLIGVERMAKEAGIDFKFILGDTTQIVIDETDLLFIDTDHTQDQLRKELRLHSDKAKKVIILHDTESYKELWRPIGELLAKGQWKVKQHFPNNNGLTVLERI